MARRKSRNWTPTARQREVLHLLASTGPMTARDVERAYLGIPQSTALAIFNALGRRGLVDVAAGGHFVRGRYVRAFALTDEGARLESSIIDEDV